MKKAILFTAILSLAAVLDVAAADAKTNYESQCAKCHGADGKGQTAMGKRLKLKDYTDAKTQESFTDEAAIKAIKEGVKKEDVVRMKPAEGLSDEDIKALVAYVRAFKK